MLFYLNLAKMVAEGAIIYFQHTCGGRRAVWEENYLLMRGGAGGVAIFYTGWLRGGYIVNMLNYQNIGIS